MTSFIADYVIVGSVPNQVFKTATLSYVPLTDSGYVAWRLIHDIIAGVALPLRVANEQQLWDYLDNFGITLPAGKQISDAKKAELIGKMDKVQLQVLFNHENRIRARENRAAVTKDQFIDFVKGLL